MTLRNLMEGVLSEGPAGRILRRLPFAETAYRRFFRSKHGRYNYQCGYFRSFEEAAAAIPRGVAPDWDTDASSEHYLDFSKLPSSYAVLYWLTRALEPGMTVVDVGGGVGQMYHAFCERAPLPAGVSWHVVEVPAMVEAGRRRAERERSTGLTFGTDSSQTDRCDILHSSGALQFMPQPIPGLLERLSTKPRWIILNKIFLTPGTRYWTLHNFGTGICTYEVFNERAFLDYFASHGYALRDRWGAPDVILPIPFHPEGSIFSATGLCFEATERSEG